MKTELADVNVLVALVVESSSGHADAMAWLRQTPRFATTPITEVGLVRLLLNPSVVPGVTITLAVESLARIKALPGAQFWPDGTSLADRRAITAHVRGHGRVTDTHLVNLAIANNGILATFDRRIEDSLAAKDRVHVHILGR